MRRLTLVLVCNHERAQNEAERARVLAQLGLPISGFPPISHWRACWQATNCPIASPIFTPVHCKTRGGGGGVLYGEASPSPLLRSNPSAYPFMYRFWQERSPFHIPLIGNSTSFTCPQKDYYRLFSYFFFLE